MGPVMWVSYIALAKTKKIVLVIQEGRTPFDPPAHKVLENPGPSRRACLGMKYLYHEISKKGKS
jgi:hypothetical protein